MRSDTPHASDPTPADQAVWDDLSLVLDQLDTGARGGGSPAEFYRLLLTKVAPLLAASRGAVWICEADGLLRPVAVTSQWATAIDDRPAHESLVAAALDAGDVVLLAPGAAVDGVPNTTSEHLLLTPVSLAEWTSGARGTVALVELALPAGRAPSSYQGAAELLRAAAQVAAEYHVRRELADLSGSGAHREALITFAERVGGNVDLHHTALRIVNEGARVVGCDRLSVLTATPSASRLWATSGTDHVERRGRAARALQQLATMATKLDEPIYYSDNADDEHDLLPQVAEVVSRYVDEFHARSLVVMPMPVSDDDDQSPRTKTRGVVVAEQFAAGSEFDRLAVAEVARAAAPAMATAIAWHELPLSGLLQTMGWLRMPRTLFRVAVATLLLVVVATALLAIPAPMTVDVRGRLVPVERQEVFAPHSGIVDELLVRHGDHPTAGQDLLVLRDPELTIEIERLAGEQQRLTRQLEAVRATRTTVDTRQRDPLELYRLSAEEEELKTKLQNLAAELKLLESQAKSLVVASPLAGMVTTWQVEQRLAVGRPVERGQVLLSVANTEGAWQLELDLPDERLDLIRSADQTPLVVEYRLASDASALHRATVTRVADRVDRQATATGSETAIVKVEAMPEGELPAELRAAALRPGGSVRARILVGNRSLAYVLTSDLWRALRNWWEF